MVSMPPVYMIILKDKIVWKEKWAFKEWPEINSWTTGTYAMVERSTLAGLVRNDCIVNEIFEQNL